MVSRAMLLKLPIVVGPAGPETTALCIAALQRNVSAYNSKRHRRRDVEHVYPVVWRASVCDIAGGADAARELDTELRALEWYRAMNPELVSRLRAENLTWTNKPPVVERVMKAYVSKIAFDPQDHSQRAGLVLLLLIDGIEPFPEFVRTLIKTCPNGLACVPFDFVGSWSRWGAFGSDSMKVEVRVVLAAETREGLRGPRECAQHIFIDVPPVE